MIIFYEGQFFDLDFRCTSPGSDITWWDIFLPESGGSILDLFPNQHKAYVECRHATMLEF